jgi:tRNA nucleotidyltransferase (CCA-adding enzyme)
MDACRDLCMHLDVYSLETVLDTHFFPKYFDEEFCREIKYALNLLGNDHFMIWRELPEDKLFGQFAKEHKKRVREMQESGFELGYDEAFATDVAFFSFVEVLNPVLSSYEIVPGPPAGLKGACVVFKKKHIHTFIHKGMYAYRNLRGDVEFEAKYPDYEEARGWILCGDDKYERKIAKILGIG